VRRSHEAMNTATGIPRGGPPGAPRRADLGGHLAGRRWSQGPGYYRRSACQAARAVDSEVSGLYWSVGRDILDRLPGDLRAAFPDQPAGHGATSLHAGLRGRLAAPRTLCTRLVHNAGQGWSRAVLECQIGSRLHRRAGRRRRTSSTSCPRRTQTWPSWSADPYVFDHLSLTRPVAERDLEQALMDRLQATLLEFGHGMAFVGRQFRFDPDGDELVVDLLLFTSSSCATSWWS